MNRERFRISAPAVLALALIYYLSPVDKLLAVLFPVLVHELGHILALRLLGLRICRFRVEMKGLCIGYRGYAGALGHTLAAAAGPAFGLFYALGASLLASRHQSSWLELTAGVSLLLSLFNLLPALPLDGGRILYHFSYSHPQGESHLLPALPLDGGRILYHILSALLEENQAERVSDIVSLAVGTILLGLGAYLMFCGLGLALELAAVWLLLSTGRRTLPARYHDIKIY